jgi:osmoprotectant transport system substrate-binding protein
MADTKGAQIVYEPAPVVRAATLERYPVIGPLLSRAFASFSLTRMQTLNAQIALDGEPPREVARRYLERERLLP